MPTPQRATRRTHGTERTQSSGPIPAAEYVRMSTDYQRYSIEYQQNIIASYAARNGFSIVRSYIDPGKSGLRMERRDALRRLLGDVEEMRADFKAILVYDVSRWGRFQDFDESAHYEFICKRAGVPVIYCAEQFENDGTVVAQIIKSLKRAMAGEYSRELSVKVFEGHRRSFLRGYFQGGIAPYAFRRMLIDESGKPRGILRIGERRHYDTDNIVLTPGPREERETVVRIFRLFTERRMPREHIAALLNNERRFNAVGKPWTGNQIRRILADEKYIGNLIYGLTAKKLLGPSVRMPRHSWLRIEGAHTSIVQPKLFGAAQAILENPWWSFTDQQLLDHLTAAFCVHGYLTSRILMNFKYAPAPVSYQERFGTLTNAYRLIGYKQASGYPKNKPDALPRLHRNLICKTISTLERDGRNVVYDEKSRTLRVDGAIEIAIIVVPYTEPRSDIAGWTLRFVSFPRGNFILVARMNKANTSILDYYLVPRSICPATILRFTRGTLARYRPFKIRSLSRFQERYHELSPMRHQAIKGSPDTA